MQRLLSLFMLLLVVIATGCGGPVKAPASKPTTRAACALREAQQAQAEGRLLRAARLLRELSRRCPRSAKRAALVKRVEGELATPKAKAPDVAARLRSRRLHAAAHQRLRLGEAKQAVATLQQAQAAWPHPRLLVDLANARRRAGDLRGARVAASQAVMLASAGSLARPELAFGELLAKPSRLIALHPSGAWVAASDGAAVIVWEASSGRWSATLGHSDKGIVALAFRADGALVTGDNEGHVRFWDIHRGDRYREELVLGDPVVDLACASRAPLLAVTTASGQLVVYDAEAHRERWRKSVGHRHVAFSADGQAVISGGDVDCRQQACDAAFRRRAIERDHPEWVAARKARRRWRRRRISLWSALDGKASRWLSSPGRRGAVAALATSPRGDLLAVNAGPRVHVYALKGRERRPRKSWIVGDDVVLAFGPRGERLVIDGALYDVEQGKKLAVWLAKGQATVRDVAVAGGRVALAVEQRRGLLRTRGALLVELGATAEATKLRWLGDRARIDGSPRLLFDPKGGRLLTVRGRRLIWWRPAGDGAPKMARAPARVATAAWAPGGATLALGHGATLELRGAESSKPTRSLRFDAVVEALAFRPDGKELAVGVGDDVLLLDATTLATRGRYGLHDRAVRGLRYDRAGKRLLSFSRAKHARLWRLPGRAGAQPRRLTQATSTGGPLWTAALDPTGKRFVASRWVDLQLWGDGGALGQPAKVGGGVILATAFSSTGALASGDDRGVVRLWTIPAGATTPKLLRALPPQADRITDLAFSPDGAALAASDAVGVTALYRVADGARVARLVADAEGRWLVERGAELRGSKRGDEQVYWKVGAHVLPGWFRQAW